MRTSTCLLPKVILLFALNLALSVAPTRSAIAQDEGVVPASYQSGGFFNKQLGTALRFNYHTQGYGTQEGVVSLGGMKVFNMDGAAMFVDGQGTLSDDFGGGFNLGVGYRQLTTLGMNFDPQRILGVGFWTDGQSTASDNFFTQLGFSLESLGESYDMRLNGHFPLERTQTSDPTLTGSGDPFFMGNNIFGAVEEFVIDTAHTVVDGEIAKRIMDLEAWAFVGGYHLGGGGVDTGGYRVGVRGYAVPDLAVSLQVTEDNIYDANLMFGITWFIGRTHKGNGPCGNILDRFREPVQRNDFIALSSQRESGATGNALTAQGTTDEIRIVHVDSNAAAGGDGTFENPFDEITDIDAIANAANSMEGDIILVHSLSTFTSADGRATLQADQRLLGEGIDQNGVEIPHVVATNELGNINLPETSAGSQALARPTIDGGGLDVFTLADNNTINNFTIDNAGTAILADTVATPTLQNLQINDAVIGTALRDVTGTTVVENTVEINRATTTGLEVDGGLDGMSLAATINDSLGRSLIIQNRTGGTVDFTGVIDDDAAMGGTFSDGVLVDMNADSTINLTNTQNILVDDGETAMRVTNNTNSIINATGAIDLTATGTGAGLVVDGNDVDTTVTFADLNATAVDGNTVDVQGAGTVSISSADDTRIIANTGTGDAFFNDGTVASAIVTVNSNIENTVGGNAVHVTGRTENTATFNGTVNDEGEGVFITMNTGGTIDFTQSVTTNVSGASHGINLDTNLGATIMFNGVNSTTSGTGTAFRAIGGGNLVVASPNTPGDNTISTQNGIGLDLQGMTIDPGNVTFEIFNVSGANLAAMGINLQNLDGTGQVVIGGTDATHGGSIGTAGAAINVDNAANVSITNLTVANNVAANTGAGVVVTNQETGSVASFTNMTINTADGNAVTVGDGMAANSNEDGVITFSNLTATTTGDGDGISIDNEDTSTASINFTDVAIDIQDSDANTNVAKGFVATGGGTITVVGTNTIDSDADTSFEANDVRDLTASNVTIDNTAAQGVVVSGLNTATDSVTLTNFDVTTTTADAVTVENNSDGTITFNSLTADSTTGDTVVVNNNTGATVNFNSMTATSTDGDAFSATGGGTLAATGTNNVITDTGRAVNIENMTIGGGNVTFANVDATDAGGTAINLDTLTGGQVAVNGGTLTGNAAATGTAVTVNDSDNVAINNVDIDYSASAQAGLVATNSAGDSLTLSNVGVMTSTGAGVDVDGGTLTATGTNTIDTTTGTGLSIQNAAIGGGGANFSDVDVNGATNGVVLNNLTGGQVTVGSGGAVSTITTTGDAITVTNTANVNLNNIDVTSATTGLVVTNNNASNFDLAVDDLTVDNTGTSAVVASHTGAGTFTFAVTNSDFDNIVDINADGTGDVNLTFNDTNVDTTVNDVAFTLLLGTNVTNANVQVRRSDFTSDDAVAFDFDANSAGIKNVEFELSNSTASNNSASPSAEIDASGATIMNATITTNIFTNLGAGDNFDIAANSANTVINMLMTGNSSNGGTDSAVLRELNLSDFNIVDGVNVETNNGGIGNFIYDSPGNVNGDFDDIPALP